MAKRAVGTRIQIGSNYIAEITDIGGLDIKADTIDVTALDSSGGYRTFIAGFKDAGDVTLSGFFNPGDPGQAAIYASFQSGQTDSYNIVFPSALGASWTFQGVVTGFKTGAAVQDAVSFDATIKVSGNPTLATAASADLTSLALTGTAGTLSPTYAAGKYAYSYSFTGASLTVTPTLTGALTDIYVDNVIFQQGLVSGVASNAIPFAAVGSRQITLFESETGKSVKTYDIAAIRTA